MVKRATSQGPRGSVNWHNLVIKILVYQNVDHVVMDNTGKTKTQPGGQDQQMGKQNSILPNSWTHYSSQVENSLCFWKQLEKDKGPEDKGQQETRRKQVDCSSPGLNRTQCGKCVNSKWEESEERG